MKSVIVLGAGKVGKSVAELLLIAGKGEYKVGDLGMSKIIYDNTDLLSTRVGTPIYFAP